MIRIPDLHRTRSAKHRLGGIIGLYLILSGAMVWAQDSISSTEQNLPPAGAPTSIYSPEAGYSCDREQQLCWQNGQPIFSMTRIQFGNDAAMNLLKETPQIVDLEGEIFHPEPDVSCDFGVQICYRDFKASVELTEQYFSPTAAAQLIHFQTLLESSEDHPVFDPTRGAKCARKARICYDQKGPSIGLTRFFFGNDRAIQLLGSLLKRQVTNP